MVKQAIKAVISAAFFCVISVSCLAKDYLITDYGAKTGPNIINTVAINKAIMACAKAGGGRVIIPVGTFHSGTIIMQSNVELHLSHGAFLLASTDLKDFPKQTHPSYRSLKDPGGWRALIYANEKTNFAITGSGTIDGNGAQQKPDPESKLGRDLDGRPRNLLFVSSSFIRVEGIVMRNSGLWNQHYLNCESVIVDRITVYNHGNRNNDGIDIDGCRRFVLSNSIFDTDDDAIVLKSTGAAPTEDVVITNCIVSSFCNAIKAGTESTGGFKNISISNCIIRPSRNTNKPINRSARGISGLALEVVDGGIMDGVSINNITIEGTDCPLFIRLGNRARKHIPEAPEPAVGKLRNVVISNVVAHNTGNYSASITAIPGHYVENVSISNVQFFNRGGLKAGEYLPNEENVKELEESYPEATIWKELPSSGLFIRHAKNIQITGLTLNSEELDPRIPVVAADVHGLLLKGIGTINNSGAEVFFKGRDVKNAVIESPLGWGKTIKAIN